jgi:CHAT domain-containing protein
MKSIKMDFVRDGGDMDVLKRGERYHVVVESSRHRQFEMPLDHETFLDRLAELRYHPLVSQQTRETALIELSQVVTEVLDPPNVAGVNELAQLDLVTDARELWALPFEAALDKEDGKPLFTQRQPAVVLTRRRPIAFAERKPSWPARPRILFAHASPSWLKGAPQVPASEHKAALLKVLQPWVEPFPGLPFVVGKEDSVLTTLANASLDDIKKACQTAKDERRPYTHVHLLAHGVEIVDPVYKHKTRYGIGLGAEDGKPTAPEALAAALRPEGAEQELPVAVTLAICDGGNAANTIIEAGGVAQELHRAGVPIVVASQLPLTFRGSEIVTTEFYRAWMAGKDVREALHATRVALYEAKPEEVGHDWLSMVAYVRLPEGYSDYLLLVRLRSQLAALETASNYARVLLEKNITDPGQCDQVVDRLQKLAKHLEQILNEPGSVAYDQKNEVVQENAGLLGSTYKRLAELLAWRADADAAQRERWLADSRASLAKSREAYRAGFLRNPAHHWSGVQYLALDAVLSGKLANVPHWYACYVAAQGQRDQPGIREEDRIWALGSIAELALLAVLDQGLASHSGEAAAALKDLCARVKALPAGTFPDLSPILSTRRQLMRYVDWWKKANGFFEARPTDLVEEARKLVQVLDD